MSLVFIGDVASPNADCSEALALSLRKAGEVFAKNATIANLEGMIADINVDTPTPVLFNHPSVLGALKEFNVKAVSLANNHTLDLPDQLFGTKVALEEAGIGRCGSGVDETDANAPARFDHGGKSVLVFGWCWGVLMQHQKNPNRGCRVNTIHPKRMLAMVRAARASDPEACIVLKVHWSFDLETRPFPMYRLFARELIDAGADAIIGCHSHCVQGGERYKDGVIVYGLGNFFIPWYTFINGSIHFPEFARQEMALEFDPVTRKAKCHWFRYDEADGSHNLDYEGEEDFDTGVRIQTFSPYRKMDDKTYLGWFKKNRRKGKFMPVYRNPHETFRNSAIDTYLKARIRFARILARTGLREWNN